MMVQTLGVEPEAVPERLFPDRQKRRSITYAVSSLERKLCRSCGQQQVLLQQQGEACMSIVEWYSETPRLLYCRCTLWRG